MCITEGPVLRQWHLGNKSPAYLPSHRGYDRYFGYYSGVMDYFTHAQVSLALGIPAASAICGVCWLHL